MTPEEVKLARRLFEAIDPATVVRLIERLEAGDSGCVEVHVKQGEARSIKLRDWILAS